ncbi:hypothetical protein ILYODFUR_003799 [Ilyodon furcidens]|uniref:Uncharacterized protein n=3 Tax=Goodeidae TaxID=28758 RepID=A0ABU7A1Y6_9TELE|nr:hypothetical protein [Ataeniobius toweri]
MGRCEPSPRAAKRVRETEAKGGGVGGRGLGLGCLEGFTGVKATLARANHARPLPAVSACTVTSQSYSVNPNIPVAFSSSVHCNPRYTAFETLPVHGTVLNLLFVVLMKLFILSCPPNVDYLHSYACRNLVRG